MWSMHGQSHSALFGIAILEGGDEPTKRRQDIFRCPGCDQQRHHNFHRLQQRGNGQQPRHSTCCVAVLPKAPVCQVWPRASALVEDVGEDRQGDGPVEQAHEQKRAGEGGTRLRGHSQPLLVRHRLQGVERQLVAKALALRVLRRRVRSRLAGRRRGGLRGGQGPRRRRQGDGGSRDRGGCRGAPGLRDARAQRIHLELQDIEASHVEGLSLP
mmetsp:Transcript_7763/g.23339  ORF Transcript_7763/g.23339 Transcript_7763/m.23339 type:complete len:213 (+) Transcript_7763:155-793(+)